jgi:hypothetical protein
LLRLISEFIERGHESAVSHRSGEAVSTSSPRGDPTAASPLTVGVRCIVIMTLGGAAGQPASASVRPGPVAVAAGQAVLDIDAIIADTERMQTVALGSEILLLC